MSYFEPVIKRGIIIDHYQDPRNHGLVKNDDRYKEIHSASASCIDDIFVQVLIEKDIIKDVRFFGEACTISTSSTSIMTDMIKGKTLVEAKVLIENYKLMVGGKSYDQDLLEEANAFCDLHRQPNRVKCGLIGVEALAELIDGKE